MDVANNDNDDGNLDDEVQELPAVLKLASYREAISCLEDVLDFLESKGNADTADSLFKVISNAQRDWLQCCNEGQARQKFLIFFQNCDLERQ